MLQAKGSARNQYLGTFCQLLIALSFGAACGWASPSIPVLRSEESPLSTGPITDDQVSWITSLLCIGCIVGIAVYGWAIEGFGRKLTAVCLGVPFTVSWLLIALAPSPVYLYVGRFLAGFGGGAMFIVVPIYVAEIAETRIRGFLGSFLIFAANTGVFIAFVAGAYLDYVVAALVFVPLGVLAFAGSCYFPETPIFLARRNKYPDAEESLRFYRGLPGNGTTESLVEELRLLKVLCAENQSEEKTGTQKLALSDFLSRPVRKAIVIGITLAILNQLSGCVAMIQYSATIFEKTGSILSPNASTIFVGFMQVLGTYVSTVMVERAGRKLLVAASALGTGAGLLGLATCCYLASIGVDVSKFSWAPFLCFCVIIFSANFGILSLPFLILAEILPEKVKPVLTTAIMLLLQFFMFIAVKFLPTMMVTLELHGTMLTFASISISGAIFVLAYMPETKGKSSAEILKMLEK